MDLHLLLFTLLFIFLCEGGPFNEDKNLDHSFLKVDWMSAIPDDKPLSAVTVPGTHESVTLHGGPLFQCQVWSLNIQLDAGLRYFGIGATSHQQFKDVLSTLKNFLVKHKSETVLLRVKADKADAIKRIKLTIEGDSDVWSKLTVPTMAEARGKIVFMASQNVNLGVVNRETNIKGDSKFKNVEKTMKVITERLNEAKGICANNLVLTESNGKQFLGIGKTPKAVAKLVNPELFKYLSNLLKSPERPVCLGIIGMDFPGPDLIEVIIKFNGQPGNNGAKEESGKQGGAGEPGMEEQEEVEAQD